MKKSEINKIDKAIKFIAPSWAAKRLKARAFMAAVDSYTGASRTRSSMKNWQVSRGDANIDTLGNLPLLRERSRDLARNSPLGGGAINTGTTNIVGTGLKFQSRVDSAYLGLSDEQAEQIENKIEREFSIWACNCDVAKILNFDACQALAIRQTFENGDAVILLPRVDDKFSDYSLKLQFVEGDRLSNPNSAMDSDKIAGGIEKNENGQPIKYYISDKHPGNYISRGSLEWAHINAFGGNTGLKNIIHLFDMLRPGQNRGIPFLAPVIEKIKQIDRYIDAELMASVIQGMYSVFIETPEGGSDIIGEESDIGDVKNKDSKKELTLDYGIVQELNPGEKISLANPMRPNQQFEGFVNALIKQIGSLLEIPYEVLIKSFNSSYSASRASLLEAWRFFRTRRKWLIDYFCQPIFEIWLYEAVLKGKIVAPGFFTDMAIMKAYSGSLWIGPTPGQIDPLKEINAAIKRIDSGISTVARETAEFTGEDFGTNMNQIRKERKILRDVGLVTEEKEPSKKTVNEGRISDGLEPIPGGDAIFMPASEIPALEFEEKEVK